MLLAVMLLVREGDGVRVDDRVAVLLALCDRDRVTVAVAERVCVLEPCARSGMG